MYRLYIVYMHCRGSPWIMVLPGLLYLASISTSDVPSLDLGCPNSLYHRPYSAMGILLLCQTSLPQSSLFSQINFGLAAFSIMAAMHILLTGLISARLMLHRFRIQKLVGSGTHSLSMYTSVSTILIESSALYSAFALMFIIPFGMDHPSSRFFLPLLAQVQVKTSSISYPAKETEWRFGMARLSPHYLWRTDLPGRQPGHRPPPAL